MSLEMSHVDLTRRAVASKSGVNPGKIKSGRLGERDLTAMTDAFAWLARLRDNITIYDQLRVPDTLPPGEYVLGLRWDCETSAQVWQSCADVTITAPKKKLVEA